MLRAGVLPRRKAQFLSKTHWPLHWLIVESVLRPDCSDVAAVDCCGTVWRVFVGARCHAGVFYNPIDLKWPGREEFGGFLAQRINVALLRAWPLIQTRLHHPWLVRWHQLRQAERRNRM